MNELLKNAQKRAKESLKILEMIETGAVEKAKDWVKSAKISERSKKTNQKILQSLKKMGLASQDEVDKLKSKIADLEAQIKSLKP